MRKAWTWARWASTMPVTVQANAALVEGILDNLIDNALRYGGRTITIELAGRTLAVVDDGPGIAPEAAARPDAALGARPCRPEAGAGRRPRARDRRALRELLDAELRFEQGIGEAGGLRVSVAFAPTCAARGYQASAG